MSVRLGWRYAVAAELGAWRLALLIASADIINNTTERMAVLGSLPWCCGWFPFCTYQCNLYKLWGSVTAEPSWWDDGGCWWHPFFFSNSCNLSAFFSPSLLQLWLFLQWARCWNTIAAVIPIMTKGSPLANSSSRCCFKYAVTVPFSCAIHVFSWVLLWSSLHPFLAAAQRVSTWEVKYPGIWH